MEAQLCICNKCGTIMIDENADEQPEFENELIDVCEATPQIDGKKFSLRPGLNYFT